MAETDDGEELHHALLDARLTPPFRGDPHRAVK